MSKVLLNENTIGGPGNDGKTLVEFHDGPFEGRALVLYGPVPAGEDPVKARLTNWTWFDADFVGSALDIPARAGIFELAKRDPSPEHIGIIAGWLRDDTPLQRTLTLFFPGRDAAPVIEDQGRASEPLLNPNLTGGVLGHGHSLVEFDLVEGARPGRAIVLKGPAADPPSAPNVDLTSWLVSDIGVVGGSISMTPAEFPEDGYANGWQFSKRDPTSETPGAVFMIAAPFLVRLLTVFLPSQA